MQNTLTVLTVRILLVLLSYERWVEVTMSMEHD